MRKNHRTHFFVALAAFFLAAGGARAASSPLGVWIDDTGEGGVEITECGKKLCGHLVWFNKAENAENCGKQILGEAAPVGGNTWDNGWIYSPEKKKRFDLELKPLSEDKLQVMGYAGLKFLNKTMIWSRAPADLVRCAGGTRAAAEPASPESEPARAAAAPPAADDTPDDPPRDASSRAARAEAAPLDEKPARRRSEERRAAAENDDGDRPARGKKKDCTLEVPYVTLTFPCKD